MLFASYKNLGLAAAVAIVLFGARASMSAAICIFAENLFYIVLYYLMHRMDSTSKSMRL
jgi:ACR3 family arsenite efflux pump ArsB